MFLFAACQGCAGPLPYRDVLIARALLETLVAEGGVLGAGVVVLKRLHAAGGVEGARGVAEQRERAIARVVGTSAI